jgi:zinc finger CCHC domain-containing protein 9
MVKGYIKKQKAKLTKEERRAKYTKLARDRREKNERRDGRREAVCFKCRQKGHTSKDCSGEGAFCYKCGSAQHSLKECEQYRKGDKELPFATCYVCSNKGHLASSCPDNTKGIFVGGGGCRICGSKQHLATHCPEGPPPQTKAICEKKIPRGEFLDDFLKEGTGINLKREMKSLPQKKIQKIVKF